MGGKKRMSQKDFDVVYRAIFSGGEVNKPKVKFRDPDKW